MSTKHETIPVAGAQGVISRAAAHFSTDTRQKPGGPEDVTPVDARTMKRSALERWENEGGKIPEVQRSQTGSPETPAR